MGPQYVQGGILEREGFEHGSPIDLRNAKFDFEA